MRYEYEFENCKGEMWIDPKELANSVGVTSKYVSLIERKNLKPSPAVMEKISKCVGEPIQKLFLVSYEYSVQERSDKQE